MAPRKRARNDADDEVVAIETASSSLRLSGQQKKARLSVNQGTSKSRNAPERSPSTASSDDDETSEAEPEEDIASGLPATQYEILRDNGFKHLERPEEDDKLATQALERRRGRIGQNVAAENAIIEEITCVNFMCHTRLHVKLGPLINFVVGMNGSGKSAVLTALTLCLGGKASATNRGSSLKSLIRGNEEQAILTVKLKNEGSDAYQPDLYGDSILVERHFSKSGTSGYRLKNALGRTVSTKKGDVDDIIEYFNLQVDNPMNVLTQDAAKSFIQNSKPAEKYKFFYEGVQLQQLDNDYRLVSDTCDAIESKLQEAKGDIKVLKRKYDTASERANIVRQHRGLRDMGRTLRGQLAWVQVEEQEATHARKEKKIASAKEMITQVESNVEKTDETFRLAEIALQNSAASVQQLEQDLAPLKIEEENAKDANVEASKSIETFRTEQRQINASLTAAKEKVADINISIDEEKRRIEDANGGAHSRKQEQIEEARKAFMEAKEALNTSEEETPLVVSNLRNAEEGLKDAEFALSLKRKEVDDCRRRLHELKNNRANVMDGYDRNMPRLLQAIRNDRSFREQPVGPMGLHIKLLKPVWSNMVEAVLGAGLNAFVVTSKADHTRLSSILRQFKMDYCPVFIGNHNPINTTEHEPDTQYETILRVLDIDNDLVRNQLVIHNSVDQCLLIRKQSDAYRTMYSGPKPKNVKVALSLNDFKRDFGHRLGYTGRNNDDEDVGPIAYQLQRKPRMKTDSDSQVSLQTETLGQLEREMKDVESRFKQLRLASNKCLTALNTQKHNRSLLKVNLQRAEERVETLESELDRDNVEDGRLEALKGYLAEAENEFEMYKDTYRNCINEKDKLNVLSTKRKRELEAVKERVADHESKIRKAELKLRNTTQARQMVLRDKNHIVDQIALLRGDMITIEQERDAQAEVVETYIKEATEVCQRVSIPEGETQASLGAKFNKIQQQVRTYNKKLGGTDEQITLAQEVALRNFQTATSNFEDMTELLHLLKQSFLNRMAQFRRFQRHISASSRINFNYLLAERLFRGKLSIDHQTKLLDVHVEPDKATKSSKGRETKTLSGGEKSFSSICLLLSLWEAMGAPLRCLDEYDVFMDDVNRDVSTKMIITAARRSVGRQYIMITPKALGSGAANAEDVRIIKLEDPREKQRKIDEMMQAA